MTKQPDSAIGESDNPALTDGVQVPQVILDAGAAVLLEMSGDDFSNFDRAEASFAAMMAAFRVEPKD